MNRQKRFDLTPAAHLSRARLVTLVGIRPRLNWRIFLYSFIFICYFCPAAVLGQVKSPVRSQELKKLSVEELMNLEVTSVSKAPEKLTEVASAIQVITNEGLP